MKNLKDGASLAFRFGLAVGTMIFQVLAGCVVIAVAGLLILAGPVILIGSVVLFLVMVVIFAGVFRRR